MTFQASDLKRKQFLDLLDDELNIIEPSYTKEGLQIKHFRHSNSSCARATRAITNHAPIGEYYLRFFPKEDISCSCRSYPTETRKIETDSTYRYLTCLSSKKVAQNSLSRSTATCTSRIFWNTCTVRSNRTIMSLCLMARTSNLGPVILLPIYQPIQELMANAKEQLGQFHQLVEDLISGLQFLHSRLVAHRDIKPCIFTRIWIANY